MVKASKKGTAARRTKAAPRPNPARFTRPALDKAALAHAMLLADPCGAPMAHPVYAGGDSGYLIRADNFVRFAAGGGATAGLLHWVPGAINSAGTDLIFMNPVNDTTVAAAGTVVGVTSPGASFLAAQASVYRCVAACVKLTYVGSESARKGRMFWGNTSGGYVASGDSTTVSNLATGLQYYSRVPPTEVEINWVPNDSDALFVDPNTASTVDQLRRGAITVAVGGLPADDGLIARLTAVYEWQPTYGIGLAVPSGSRAQSNNTLDQVLNYVQSGMKSARKVVDFTKVMADLYGFMPSTSSLRITNS